jgi:hypothetical protein
MLFLFAFSTTVVLVSSYHTTTPENTKEKGDDQQYNGTTSHTSTNTNIVRDIKVQKCEQLTYKFWHIASWTPILGREAAI